MLLNSTLLKLPVVLSLAGLVDVAAADDSVRSAAVVDLRFDKPGDFSDSASSGAGANNGIAHAGPQSISSPFWNQKGRAIVLSAAAKQYVEIPDAPDVDRPSGLSVSLFFLGLHPPADTGFHGIFAKRAVTAAGSGTNYGLNYNPKSDAFQLYLHDGPGFKVATYSVKQAIGYRRLTHLTATFAVGDAPGADADTDADDILIRLFLNGKQLKPVRSTGFVSGNDAWVTDVALDKLVNDVPLTLGSSFGTDELTSGVYDEFLLFDRALTVAEAGRLFEEVAGPNAAVLAARPPGPQVVRPAISSVSPRGLQPGQATRLTIRGARLTDASISCGVDGTEVKVIDSKAGLLVADVTVPEDTTPGFYPLRVHNKRGVSTPVTMVLDSLPEALAASTSADKPATLPGAFSGVISGTQDARVYFKGTKGMRVVAEVSSRRLGAALEPVLEIRTDRGTPLVVEWKKHELLGDTRAEVSLPSDGVYYVELHDLAYKAPRNSAYRLCVGDLKLVDGFFPPIAARGDVSLIPLGSGFDEKTRLTARLRPDRHGLIDDRTLRGALAVDGPLPPLRTSDARQVMEQPAADGKVQRTDATFKSDPHIPLTINGRIGASGEIDHYDLDVTEGQKLYFAVAARSLGSPLDAELTVRNGNAVLGRQDGRGASRDPAFEVAVPKGVKQLRVSLRDFAEQGGPRHVYRLAISVSGRPDFRVAVADGSVEIPENGSALVRLKVTRSGPGFAYAGPITLQIAGDPGLSISPSLLPAESGNRDVFAVLTREGAPQNGLSHVAIVAQSESPALRRLATVPMISPALLSSFQEAVAAAATQPVGVYLNLAGPPPLLFRGVPAQLPLSLTTLDADRPQTIRLSLVTTETPRPVDPAKPAGPKRPLLRARANQFLQVDQSTADLRLVVPVDVAQPLIDCVVRGELVDNPFSEVAHAVVFSAPLRLNVQSAVAVTPDKASFSVPAGGEGRVRGVVRRTAGFDQPVVVSISGLPKGYTSTPATVAPDQTNFEIPVKVPAGAKAAPLKNVQLVVQGAHGGAILPNTALPLVVAAAKPEPKS